MLALSFNGRSSSSTRRRYGIVLLILCVVSDALVVMPKTLLFMAGVPPKPTNQVTGLYASVSRFYTATRYLGENQNEVVSALAYAAYAHDGQRRRSGEPFIVHPIETATILAELRMDCETVIAGLLHDTVEDTAVTFEDLREQFGDSVATIVAGVTDAPATAKVENQRALFLALSVEWRVALVKLADRLHNMRTLGSMPKPKQVRKSEETMQLFVPLARSLGLAEVEKELRRLSSVHLVAHGALLSERIPGASRVLQLAASKRCPGMLDEFLSDCDTLKDVEAQINQHRATLAFHRQHL